MTEAGPKVLEFNVRLGDPETQPLMKRMASDFVPALMAAASGELAGGAIEWHTDPTVCVVLASGGYPGSFATGKSIHGIAEAEATGVTVFQAGTKLDAPGRRHSRRPRSRRHRRRLDARFRHRQRLPSESAKSPSKACTTAPISEAKVCAVLFHRQYPRECLRRHQSIARVHQFGNLRPIGLAGIQPHRYPSPRSDVSR